MVEGERDREESYHPFRGKNGVNETRIPEISREKETVFPIAGRQIDLEITLVAG